MVYLTVNRLAEWPSGLENCSQSRMDVIPIMAICHEVYNIDMEGKMEKIPKDIRHFSPNLIK